MLFILLKFNQKPIANYWNCDKTWNVFECCFHKMIWWRWRQWWKKERNAHIKTDLLWNPKSLPIRVTELFQLNSINAIGVLRTLHSENLTSVQTDFMNTHTPRILTNRKKKHIQIEASKRESAHIYIQHRNRIDKGWNSNCSISCWILARLKSRRYQYYIKNARRFSHSHPVSDLGLFFPHYHCYTTLIYKHVMYIMIAVVCTVLWCIMLLLLFSFFFSLLAPNAYALTMFAVKNLLLFLCDYSRLVFVCIWTLW